MAEILSIGCKTPIINHLINQSSGDCTGILEIVFHVTARYGRGERGRCHLEIHVCYRYLEKFSLQPATSSSRISLYLFASMLPLTTVSMPTPFQVMHPHNIKPLTGFGGGPGLMHAGIFSKYKLCCFVLKEHYTHQRQSLRPVMVSSPSFASCPCHTGFVLFSNPNFLPTYTSMEPNFFFYIYRNSPSIIELCGYVLKRSGFH